MADSITNQADRPFHEGELELQASVGVRDAMDAWGRQVIRPNMPDQHRKFYAELPFVIAAARDSRGRPWASILTGPQGFIASADEQHLRINSQLLPGDGLGSMLEAGTDIGLLGIDLAARRRNRVNGRLSESGPDYLDFKVKQSFGNCPQYITPRDWYYSESANAKQSPLPVRQSVLSNNQVAWIRSADTVFLASGYQQHEKRSTQAAKAGGPYGMDASHRGGPKGFIKVNNKRSLTIPDYAGNNYFNTLGNILKDGRVGMLLVDFARGSLLQLTGRARIETDPDKVRNYQDAQRLLLVDIDEVVERQDVLPLRWQIPEASALTLKVIETVRESKDVVSFYLQAADGSELPQFKAGQHLPIELYNSESDQLLQRTYSLSDAPNQPYYRISVKRESHGAASQFLHGKVTRGDIIKAKKPAGDFVLQPAQKAMVLISAGVGITPVLSMLKTAINTSPRRRIHFLHGARNSDYHSFAEELNSIADNNAQVMMDIAYSQPLDTDVLGQHYTINGRLSAEAITNRIDSADAVYYLCGPPGFIAGLTDTLSTHGVPETQIHYETF